MQLSQRRHDTQQNDIQHNDVYHDDTKHNGLFATLSINNIHQSNTQYNDAQHNVTEHYDSQHNNAMYYVMLSVAFLLLCWVFLRRMSLWWVSWRRYSSPWDVIYGCKLVCSIQHRGDEFLSRNWCFPNIKIHQNLFGKEYSMPKELHTKDRSFNITKILVSFCINNTSSIVTNMIQVLPRYHQHKVVAVFCLFR